MSEILTGEGKSTIIFIKVAIWALAGERTVVVTSSSLLGIRDSVDWRKCFEMLGLTVSHNHHDDPGKLRKAYESDIVYGALHDFQAHKVLDEFHDRVNVLTLFKFENLTNLK